MTTKVQQVLDPWSVWNQAPNDEPLFILKAEEWRYVMLLALNSKDKGGRMSMQELYDKAVAMKKYHDENDIPF